MEARSFWQSKIVQFFHDPPAKPYASWPGSGGHRKIAAQLFEFFTKRELKGYPRYPDWAASGADRPLISPPSRTKGVSTLQVHWHKYPQVTHPLASGWCLDLRAEGEEEPDSGGCTVRDEVLEDEERWLKESEEVFDDWGDVDQLKRGFLRLWRRYKDELVFSRDPAKPQLLLQNLLWAEMPADSRCPDHSIWDHLRVTTALAFLTRKLQAPDHPQAPWMLRFGIGPVQRFIEESRTSRDLWLSSFLLADLIWHAMEPIVERYGPDCILYPDLRGNPRADVWLRDGRSEALPESLDDPSTFAAVLPNVFVALVPRGGKGHLETLEVLAAEARDGFERRWKELSTLVHDWVASQAGGNWEETWKRQTAKPFYSTWTAVPWLPMELIKDPESLRARALPAQEKGFREPTPQQREDREQIRLRRNRLAAWVPKDVWARYEWARDVYASTNLNYHQMERGFDYALTHHQLSVRHALRKETAPDSQLALDDEPGEKCTLCGKRTALAGEPSGSIDSTRRQCRTFWRNKTLDPDGTGSERLCAVCSVKRFLVEAGLKDDRFVGVNRVWAGLKPASEVLGGRSQKARVPFPSSATLGAQDFLAAVATDPELQGEIERINKAHSKTSLPLTSFPRALPQLAAANRHATAAGQSFLMREAQETIFPEAIESLLRSCERQGDKAEEAKALGELHRASLALRRAAKQRRDLSPGTRIAAIVVDGDHMHRLLLGNADSVEARWRDVIHPKAVERIKENAYLCDQGWLDLLDGKRLMGPSLHAFISRALGEFSHRVVPWVVEQEFSGCLIYAGGDDVLCLAPASEALGIVSRLQQIYSSPWVIDTRHAVDAWAWRRRDWREDFDPHRARRRFLIPEKPSNGDAIRLPVKPEDLSPHVAGGVGVPTDTAGVWLPMLGPGCSVSAAIAYGHFKTALGVMVAQARRILKELAKGRAGRRAVAVSHFSRNGVKSEFAMRWGQGNRRGAEACLANLVGQGRWLPGRLPYKLRSLNPLVKVALDRLNSSARLNEEEKRQQRKLLLEGMFLNALDISPERLRKFRPEKKQVLDDAFAVWEAGIGLYQDLDMPERFVDGLLVARYLAGGEGED